MPATAAILLGLFASALSVATFLLVKTHQRATARELRAMAQVIDSLAERMASHPEQNDKPSGSPEPVPQKPRPPHRVDRAEPPPGPTLIAVPNLAAAEGEPPELAAAELSRRYAALWDLAEAGGSAESIARATNQPIGQVELILGLKRQTSEATASPRS